MYPHPKKEQGALLYVLLKASKTVHFREGWKVSYTTATKLLFPTDLSFQNLELYHHVTPPARISLILSRQPSLLSITPGRSSRLHPVSSQSCFI